MTPPSQPERRCTEQKASDTEQRTPVLKLNVTQVGEVAVNAIQVGEREFAGGEFERAARSFDVAAHCCRALADQKEAS